MDKLEKLARSYDPGRHAGTNLSLKQLMSHPVLQPRDFQAIIYEDFHITLTVREIKDTVVPLFGHKNNPDLIDTDQFASHFLKIYYGESLKRKSKRAKKYNIDYPEPNDDPILKKEITPVDYVKLMIYSKEDIKKFIKSMRRVFNLFNSDPKFYMDRLQCIKGPATPPYTFRELYHRIFVLRLTFPEIGILYQLVEDLPIEPRKIRQMSESDIGSLSCDDIQPYQEEVNMPEVIEGPKFVVWFYKMSRLYENLSKSDKKTMSIRFFTKNKIANVYRDFTLPPISRPATSASSLTDHSIERHAAKPHQRRKSLIALDHERISENAASDKEFLLNIICRYTNQDTESIQKMNDLLDVRVSRTNTCSFLPDRDIDAANETLKPDPVTSTENNIGEDNWSMISSKVGTAESSQRNEPTREESMQVSTSEVFSRKAMSASTSVNPAEYFPMYASNLSIIDKKARERMSRPTSHENIARLTNSSSSRPTHGTRGSKSRLHEELGYLKQPNQCREQTAGLFFFPSLVLGLKEVGKKHVAAHQ